MLNIRKAVPEDIDTICELYQQLFEWMAELSPDIFINSEQDKCFVSDMINGEKSDILLAANENVLVGLVLLCEAEIPPICTMVYHKYCYVVDFVVHKAYRRTGVGTELIAETRKWCQERKLEYMEVSVLANNPALSFYENVGFKEIKKIMRYHI